MSNAATAHSTARGAARTGHSSRLLANPTFGTALTAEVRKLLTMRSTWVWLVLFTGSLFGFPVLEIIFYDPTYDPTVTWASVIQGWTITLFLGIIYGGGVAGEFSHHMHAHSYLTQNSRNSWLLARYLVVAAFTFFATTLGLLISALISVLPIGPEFDGTGSVLPLVIVALGVPVFAILAAGLAAVVRNRVAAIGLPLVWIAIVEPLILAAANTREFARTVYVNSPGPRLNDLVLNVQMADSSNTSEFYGGSVVASSGHAVIVILVWTLIFTIAGLVVNRRIDIH